jgi:hypothetical protein
MEEHDISPSQERRAWDKLPAETSKSYNAFMVYLQLPIAGAVEERRSLVNTAKAIGHASTTMVDLWSAKFNWVERAQAYDMSTSALALTVREVALESFQQATITSLGQQLAVLNELIDRKMGAMLARAKNNPADIDATELKKMTAIIEEKDSLARRASGMPTNYTTERIDRPNDEDTVFIIGG